MASLTGTARPAARRLARRTPGLIQSTQGMPFFAVTAPPWAPVVGRGTAELEDVGVAPGTAAFPPSMTWT